MAECSAFVHGESQETRATSGAGKRQLKAPSWLTPDPLQKCSTAVAGLGRETSPEPANLLSLGALMEQDDRIRIVKGLLFDQVTIACRPGGRAQKGIANSQ
jgi:hypothetical protein